MSYYFRILAEAAPDLVVDDDDDDDDVVVNDIDAYCYYGCRSSWGVSCDGCYYRY